MKGKVAVKVLDENMTKLDTKGINDFLKEIEAMISIRHHRFISLIAISIDEKLCIITELADSGNLATKINSLTPT